MANKLSDGFQLAIELEETGCAFYRHAATTTKNPKLREIFQHFAEQELQHKACYEKMKREVAAENDNLFDGKTIHDVMDARRVFNPATMDKDLRMVTDMLGLLELAIKQEQLALDLFKEMQRCYPPKLRPTFDKILNEERHHLTTLIDTRKHLTG